MQTVFKHFSGLYSGLAWVQNPRWTQISSFYCVYKEHTHLFSFLLLRITAYQLDVC